MLLIVSTMSSVKSTLVNDLLSQDILTLYNIKFDKKIKRNLNTRYDKDNNTVSEKIIDIKEKM